jgi:hypothetical protein
MVALIVVLTTAVVHFAVKNATAGVDFTLTNSGPEVLQSVTVQVTGRSYLLGDIPSGGSKTVKLKPTSESHIELLFPTAPALTIDCYFEPNDGGRIIATVISRAVVTAKDEVQMEFFFYRIERLFWVETSRSRQAGISQKQTLKCKVRLLLR